MGEAFEPALSLSVDEKTGHVRAAYLRMRQGTVAETREVSEGQVFADYDTHGSLLGIELLSPCTAQVLDDLAAREPESIRRFLRESPPRYLVSA